MANPLTGVGIIIENNNREILVGKRIGSHAPHFSIPGGKIELGESFEDAAVREVNEETGLIITAPRVIGVTNNLKTFKEEQIHFISIILHCKNIIGEPIIKEPEKCASWQWVDPYNLPEPHFEASHLSVQCFLQNKFYTQADYQV